MKQPNQWSCYITAVSICTGIPIDSLIKTIGHDGSKIIEPEKSDPWNREAFTYPELAFALHKYGWALIQIAAKTDRTAYPSHSKIFDYFVDNEAPMILITRTELGDHAYAYKNGYIIDPLTGENTGKVGVEEALLSIEVLVKIKSSVQFHTHRK